VRGSHAPSLRTLVARLCDEAKLEPGCHILCACSGGPDSNAMLSVLASLRTQRGFQLSACGVDHGLRAEAPNELAVARTLAGDLGVPFTIAGVAVGPGPNLMARARAARYEALREARARVGASLLATAHTADDRAETVLLRLLRGSGAHGLGVLPPRDADLLRPLIRARRSDVERHLARHRVSSASDPSNLDTRFARVRVRHELLPLLATLSPRIVETLCHLADELWAAREADSSPLSGLGRRQRDALLAGLEKRGQARVRTADSEEVLAKLLGGELVVTAVASRRDRKP
jgi:tRNA(Ile)-lysidine synthase